MAKHFNSLAFTKSLMGFNYLKVHAVMYHPLLCLGQTFSPENNDVTVYKFRESWLLGSLAGKKTQHKTSLH